MASSMDMNGMNFNPDGRIMDTNELIRRRKKKGECVTCGNQTHQKHMFKLIPITNHEVLAGRCLLCHPQQSELGHGQNFAHSGSHHSSMKSGGSSSRQVHAPVRTMKTSDLDQYESNQRHANAARVSQLKSVGGSSRHNNNVGSSHNSAQRASEPTSTLHGAILASAAAKGMADRYRQSHPDRNRERAQDTQANAHSAAQQHHNTSSRRVASNRMLDRGGALSASRSNLGGLKSNSRAESNRSVSSGHSGGGGSHTSSSNSNSNRRVTDVVDTIRRSAGNTVAQEHSFRALSNLDMNDSDRHVVRENGGIDEILSAMRNASIADSATNNNNNGSNAQLLASSCRALWNLSSTEDNQQAIIDGGGITVIVKALTSHADDADVQEKAIAALSNLCANPAAQKAIQESGAIEAVVSAMTNHCMDGSVQDKAGHMLCNLATTDVGIKEYIAAKGGLDALIIGMDMHPTNPIVQERGCRAIRNLCSQSEANKVQVGKSDGVDAIITAMQVHRGEAEIQLQGTWALANLAIHADNKPIIGDRGGVDVIVRAMWVNSDCALLQEWACRAIWTLSVDQVNKDLVVESGGINAVVNAMMAHTDIPAVQEKACGCLANLAANADDHKMKIVEAEGIDAIVMAMVLFSGEKRVQERAVGAIRKILCEENLDAMRAAGVGNLVEAAMEQFPDCCQSKGQDVLDMLN